MSDGINCLTCGEPYNARVVDMDFGAFCVWVACACGVVQIDGIPSAEIDLAEWGRSS